MRGGMMMKWWIRLWRRIAVGWRFGMGMGMGIGWGEEGEAGGGVVVGLLG